MDPRVLLPVSAVVLVACAVPAWRIAHAGFDPDAVAVRIVLPLLVLASAIAGLLVLLGAVWGVAFLAGADSSAG